MKIKRNTFKLNKDTKVKKNKIIIGDKENNNAKEDVKVNKNKET